MITRKVRIDISQFDPLWKAINNGSEDCYLIFMSRGAEEILNLQTQMRKTQKILERKAIEYDNLKDKINAMLLQRDEVPQELYDQEEKLEKELEKKSKDVVESVLKGLKDRFLFGLIYDEEIKGTRELKKEELGQLDSEVLKYVQGRLSGEIEKKD